MSGDAHPPAVRYAALPVEKHTGIEAGELLMPISWNEIHHNAVAFAKDWADVSREDAEAKSFWDAFFAVFGIKRRTVASFEELVKKLSGSWGYIDLFWPATLLVEHKSRGKSLEKAESQAMEYIHGLKNAARDDEIPRYVVVSDFANIALHDLEDGATFQFSLADLHRHVDKFAFIPGYQQHKLDAEDPVNIAAVELLGALHDTLKDAGYAGHDLERFLVRVLFCLFAEDTGLFERDVFTLFVENHTAADGSDLGAHLARLFQVLNTPADRRQKNLLEELSDLPFVNGDLFAETLGFADFNRDMRNRLLACCRFDWSRISPAVFGSLFQSVMEPRERRQVGAHYTSERDILKLVRSLFLDDLRAEFQAVKGNKKRLEEFHQELGRLTFFDPACGCGNFLVVTYRELRLLEIEVLRALHGKQMALDIHSVSLVDVDAMYGIEINEFPARIAEVALWLVDHQMNQRLSEACGQYFVRLPLKKSAAIRNANALRIDWRDVLSPERCSYVLGNPPFVGKKARNSDQKADMDLVFGEENGTLELDYVSCWYQRAAEYMNGTQIRAAFVSTNSISQGEQPSLLWPKLFARGFKIHFAHRTFPWESEARGKAHVHVVIIGFAQTEPAKRVLYDYENGADHGVFMAVRNINAYLIEANDVIPESRRTPICNAPPIRFGNMPNDDGNLLFTDVGKILFLRRAPEAKPYMRRFISSKEYFHHEDRWCLWLQDIPPNVLRASPLMLERVKRVREYRLKSPRRATQELANYPAAFGEIRQPTSRYILIPRVSSENRKYIPLSYFDPKVIVGDTCLSIADTTMYHFGVLSSRIHMAWVRQVCGRLKSDYRYSNEIVYNNFPWPENPTDKQKTTVEAKAQALLDVRERFSEAPLAELYDPETMPRKLAKAHAELDRAVDACYRAKRFDTDRERVEFLFGLYEKLTSPLTAGLKAPKRRRSGK
jgi:type I restriction-modification system DNA methylase subunit